jgi:hypothetical protein
MPLKFVIHVSDGCHPCTQAICQLIRLPRLDSFQLRDGRLRELPSPPVEIAAPGGATGGWQCGRRFRGARTLRAVEEVDMIRSTPDRTLLPKPKDSTNVSYPRPPPSL